MGLLWGGGIAGAAGGRMPEKMAYLGELYLACSHVTSFPRAAAVGTGGEGQEEEEEARRRRLRGLVGLPQVGVRGCVRGSARGCVRWCVQGWTVRAWYSYMSASASRLCLSVWLAMWLAGWVEG